jgi:tetratricopeptide (TPR) repeat protein
VVGVWGPNPGIAAAHAAATRALEIDPYSPEGHAALGIIAGVQAFDWVGAAERFERARRSTMSPLVRFHYAIWHLSPLEQHSAALEELDRALTLDPLYLLGRLQRALELQSVGKSDEGLRELEYIATMDPQFGPALGLLGRELAMRGRITEAWALAERAYAAAPRHPNGVGFMAGMLRRRGDEKASRRLIEQFTAQTPWASGRVAAEAAIIAGDPAAAMPPLAEAVEAGDPGIWLLLAGTAGVLLRSTPAWPALRVRLRLP